MREFPLTSEQNIDVADEIVHIGGIVTGTIRVTLGGLLHLSGTVNGHIFVGTGGEARLDGIVNGTVSNDGGRIMVTGTINGHLQENAGETFVDNEAIIRSV